MLLGNYIQNINKKYKNFFFSGISFDTKNIKKNDIFFAIKGNVVDGNKFILNAIKIGGGGQVAFTSDNQAAKPISMQRNLNNVGAGTGIVMKLGDSAATDAAHEYASIRGHIDTNTNGAEDGSIRFYVSVSGTETEIFRADENGLTLTKGIKFASTQVASTDANTLDDYEEGTWTPVIRGGTTAGTYELNTSFDDGFYQKIGRDVTVRAIVALSTSITGGGTGNYHFSGLPFNIDVSDNAGAGAIMLDRVDINRTASGVVNMVVANAGGTDGSQLRILQIEDNAGFQPLTIGQAAVNDFFEFTYNYRTQD